MLDGPISPYGTEIAKMHKWEFAPENLNKWIDFDDQWRIELESLSLLNS
jgi:hypothetical protein